MTPIVDLASLPEDKRIEMIGHRAVDHHEVVGFMVDVEDGSHSKGDRYIEKLLKRFPALRVMYRGDGPVANVETIKVGAMQWMDKVTGVLEVGSNGDGEVVINHPDLMPDANGFGHIVFSPNQARHLAGSLIRQAELAEAEIVRKKPPPPPVDRSQRTMTGGSPVTIDHREIDPVTGQQRDYVVLSDGERAKGFVRPVRNSYRHKTCGQLTTMGSALAETFARDPGFYSGTFCATCRAHFPLIEFVWVGTNEQVGS